VKATKAQVRKMGLGQIAADVPYAAQLFYKYGLDFCCRGEEQLGEACKQKGVDEGELLTELLALMKSREKTEWGTLSEHDLVQHILDAYHRELHQNIPDIQYLAMKVETVHADHPACPTGLSSLLREFWDDLKAHLKMEETFVFPLLERSKTSSSSQSYVQEVMREHVEQGERLRKIRQICRGYQIPQGACRTWQSLYLSLEKLEKDLMEHIHVENNVLFERALHDRNKVPSLHG